MKKLLTAALLGLMVTGTATAQTMQNRQMNGGQTDTARHMRTKSKSTMHNGKKKMKTTTTTNTTTNGNGTDMNSGSSTTPMTR